MARIDSRFLADCGLCDLDHRSADLLTEWIRCRAEDLAARTLADMLTSDQLDELSGLPDLQFKAWLDSNAPDVREALNSVLAGLKESIASHADRIRAVCADYEQLIHG